MCQAPEADRGIQTMSVSFDERPPESPPERRKGAIGSWPDNRVPWTTTLKITSVMIQTTFLNSTAHPIEAIQSHLCFPGKQAIY